MRMQLITEMDMCDSPTIEKVKASGRATCRICGNKIPKGEECFSFFFSLTDGGSYNPWTAISGKGHISCLPNTKVK